GGREDDGDNPTRTHGTFKSHGGHESFAGEWLPWSNKSDGCHHDGVEENADNNGHPDCPEKATGAEFRAGLFRTLYDRFEPGHEIGHDLHHQKHRHKWAMGKERRKILD